MTNVQLLVDAILDETNAAHPGIEYVIWMSPATALLLPRHGSRLWREVEGRSGAYRSLVYRNCEVLEMGAIEDWLIVVGPLLGAIPEAEDAPRYYGDLRTGVLSTARPIP